MEWAEDALIRLSKVPVGFMQNMTKRRIEEYAERNNINIISLEIAEKVIETSRAGMGSVMGGDISTKHIMKHQTEVKDEVKDKDRSSALDKKGFFCFVCGYVVEESLPDNYNCKICNSPQEKFSEIGAEYITRSSKTYLTWTKNALKRLENIPPDFKKDMTRWEIEGFARKNGFLVVSADVVDERYSIWRNIANNVKSKMIWMADVKERIKRIPETIRGMVVREMELEAERNGKDLVDMDIFEAVKAKWLQTKEFHVKWM